MKKLTLKWKTVSSLVVASAKFVSIATPTAAAVALLASWFAFAQVQHLLDATAKRGSVKADIAVARAVTVNQLPLTASGYEDARRIVSQGNPSVLVNLNKEKSGLTVSVTDPALMPEWLYLVSTMQAFQPGLIWKAEKICLKKCDGGEAAYAELKAFTQQVAIQ